MNSRLPQRVFVIFFQVGNCWRPSPAQGVCLDEVCRRGDDGVSQLQMPAFAKLVNEVPARGDDAKAHAKADATSRTNATASAFEVSKEVALSEEDADPDASASVHIPEQCAAQCSSAPAFDAAKLEANTEYLGSRRAYRIRFLEELVYVMASSLQLPVFATEGTLLALLRQRGFTPFDYDGDFGFLKRDWDRLMQGESYDSEPAFVRDIRGRLSFPISVVLQNDHSYRGPHLAIRPAPPASIVAGDWPLMDIFVFDHDNNGMLTYMTSQPELEFRPWYCTHLPVLKGSEAWLDATYSPCWRHVQLNKCAPEVKNSYASIINSSMVATDASLRKRMPAANFTGQKEMSMGLFLTGKDRLSEDHCLWDVYDGADEFPGTSCGKWIQAGTLSPPCKRTKFSIDADIAVELKSRVLLNRAGTYA